MHLEKKKHYIKEVNFHFTILVIILAQIYVEFFFYEGRLRNKKFTKEIETRIIIILITNISNIFKEI